MTVPEIKAELGKLNERQRQALRSKFGRQDIHELRYNEMTDALAVKFKQQSGAVYEWTMIVTTRGKLIDPRCSRDSR